MLEFAAEQTKVEKEIVRSLTESLEKIEEVLPEIKGRRVELVLRAILADENRHHQLLRKMLEVLVRAETISPDEWWDLIWRDVPFHGAPGG